MNSVEVSRVSVVMATYNRADDLRESIGEIFEQDYPALEVIVVNDGSNDNTLAILEHLQTLFDFKLIDNPKNLGLQKSLNRGIEQATGKYIARIDDHDRWTEKSKLSKQVAFLEKNPTIGLVGTAYRNGKSVVTNPISDAEIRKQILMRCPFCHVTILMRKNVFEKAGGYDETLPYSEDWDLWLKIGRISQMANLPDITTQVIEPTGSDSLSGQFFLKQQKLNRRLIEKYLKDYPGALKARIYHGFVRIFFSIFTAGGSAHRLMQSVFQRTFFKRKNPINVF